jgi:hypothetical protein
MRDGEMPAAGQTEIVSLARERGVVPVQDPDDLAGPPIDDFDEWVAAKRSLWAEGEARGQEARR